MLPTKKWYTWTVLLRLVFLDKEYYLSFSKQCLAVPHFSKAVAKELKAEAVVRRCSVRKGFLEIPQNSQENTRVRVSHLQLKSCNFIKIESLAQVFSSEFCEISKNTFFTKTPPVTASIKAYNFTKIRLQHGCFQNNFFMYCKNFLKVHKNTGKKCLVKYFSADGFFIKTIILLTVMITTILQFLRFFTCVSWGFLPGTNHHAANCYISLNFFFLFFFYVSSI